MHDEREVNDDGAMGHRPPKTIKSQVPRQGRRRRFAVLEDQVEVSLLVPVEVPVRRVGIRMALLNETRGLKAADEKESAIAAGALHPRRVVVGSAEPGKGLVENGDPPGN